MLEVLRTLGQGWQDSRPWTHFGLRVCSATGSRLVRATDRETCRLEPLETPSDPDYCVYPSVSAADMVVAKPLASAPQIAPERRSLAVGLLFPAVAIR